MLYFCTFWTWYIWQLLCECVSLFHLNIGDCPFCQQFSTPCLWYTVIFWLIQSTILTWKAYCLLTVWLTDWVSVLSRNHKSQSSQIWQEGSHGDGTHYLSQPLMLAIWWYNKMSNLKGQNSHIISPVDMKLCTHIQVSLWMPKSHNFRKRMQPAGH